MELNKSVFDQYFELWDKALFDENALDELINLFATKTVVKSPKGNVKGKTLLKFGIKQTLKKYVSMNHVWNTKKTDDGYVATWAVTHELKNGHMHASVGVDYIHLDENGKIIFLEIKPSQNITTKIVKS